MLADIVDSHMILLLRKLSADQVHVGGVVCTAEVDTLMDEEEEPHNVVRTVEIQDVLGSLKLITDHKEHGNRISNDTFPSISVRVTKDKFSVKRCLTSDQSDWTKTEPTNTKLSTE